MLNSLAKQPEIEQYLRSFPRAQWEKCIGLTVRLGIRTSKSLFPYGTTIENLAKLLNNQSPESLETQDIREKLNRLKSTLEARRAQVDPSPKPSKLESKYQSPTGLRDKQLRIPEGGKGPEKHSPQVMQPPFRMSGKVAEAGSDQKAVPKHLRLVESKIKEDVKRDIERFRTSDKWETEEESEKRIKPYSPREAPRIRSPETASHPEPKDLPRASHYPHKPKSPMNPDLRHSPHPDLLSSPLAEPRTNAAIVEKLSQKLKSPPLEGRRGHIASPIPEAVGEESISSVLRIADDFLADPLMVTLSGHGSPKFEQGNYKWAH